MLYSLASFAPDRETLLFARISQVVRSRPEELGQLLRNWDSLSTPPDVLSVLADEDPDRDSLVTFSRNGARQNTGLGIHGDFAKLKQRQFTLCCNGTIPRSIF